VSEERLRVAAALLQRIAERDLGYHPMMCNPDKCGVCRLQADVEAFVAGVAQPMTDTEAHLFENMTKDITDRVAQPSPMQEQEHVCGLDPCGPECGECCVGQSLDNRDELAAKLAACEQLLDEARANLVRRAEACFDSCGLDEEGVTCVWCAEDGDLLTRIDAARA